jgi:hypothetical protein
MQPIFLCFIEFSKVYNIIIQTVLLALVLFVSNSLYWIHPYPLLSICAHESMAIRPTFNKLCGPGVDWSWPSMLYVMREVPVLVGNSLLCKKAVLLAEWPSNYPSISGRGKVSAPLQSIQTTCETSLASCCSVRTWSKVAGPGSKHLSLSHSGFKNMWSCVCCTSTHLFTLTLWC